jgi:RNA polymerase sigma-70 factor (ECF subfamily)
MIALRTTRPRRPKVLADKDTRLMLQASHGDEAAFDALMARNRPRVTRTITRLMGNRQHSEDLVQEVFLRIFRARNSYVVTARFSTWLFTIVNNVVLNARRSLARRSARATFGHSGSQRGQLDCLESVGYIETPAELALRRESLQVVHLATAQLGDRQQTAFSLFYFQGLSHAAIAHSMATSEKAVKSLLHRARTRVRRSLTPYVDDGHLPAGEGKRSAFQEASRGSNLSGAR